MDSESGMHLSFYLHPLKVLIKVVLLMRLYKCDITLITICHITSYETLCVSNSTQRSNTMDNCLALYEAKTKPLKDRIQWTIA
jgi:hypothetical protein